MDPRAAELLRPISRPPVRAGQTHGQWTVISEPEGGFVRVRCSCGAVKRVQVGNLRNRSKSCRACYLKRISASRPPVFPGQVFGQWTVLSKRTPHTYSVMARCACGTEKEVNLASLRNGNRSCRECYVRRRKVDRPPIRAGETFGRWTVIADEAMVPAKGRTLVQCRCTCGTVLFKQPAVLLSGRGKGCMKCDIVSRKLPFDAEDAAAVLGISVDGVYRYYQRNGMKETLLRIKMARVTGSAKAVQRSA